MVAEHAAAHPGLLEGWASVNPREADAVAELERCVHELKQHLTLYSRRQANDFSRVPRLGAEESYDERATG